MEIRVKSVKVLKAGNNQYGDWKLVKVYTDNEEYTTLANDAEHIPSGSTINITDMDEDTKGKKFKKFEIITLGNAPPVSAGTEQPNDNEYWERKQSIERTSIEAQVAFKGMVELISTGMLKTDTKEYKATIEWAMARIDLPSVIITKVEEAKGETAQTDNQPEETVEVTNAGSLFKWIMSQDPSIKVPRLWVQTELGLPEKEVITNEKAKELHQDIKNKMGW